jgi:prepilin-type processing-associated H-X9-DG protein
MLAPGPTSLVLCPADSTPNKALILQNDGVSAYVPCSYAYNVALPLLFRNTARVTAPVNTVAFYDGDPTAVAAPGVWQYSASWAESTVRARHRGSAQYLYLDGHVNATAAFPSEAFGGCNQWLASALDTRPASQQELTNLSHYIDADVGASININPGNGWFEFNVLLPDNTAITRDDLQQNKKRTGPGFGNGKNLEYAGQAQEVWVKPKGNGNNGGLTVNGQPVSLTNKNRYVISGDLQVHVYNSKGHGNGQWWIDISATHADVKICEGKEPGQN